MQPALRQAGCHTAVMSVDEDGSEQVLSHLNGDMLQMKRVTMVVLMLTLALPGTVYAANAPIEADTCRLYNAYYLDGRLVSDSQGIIYNGQYSKASSANDCMSYCRKEEKSRADQVYGFNRENYYLEVECFYGDSSLYSNVIHSR